MSFCSPILVVFTPSPSFSPMFPQSVFDFWIQPKYISDSHQFYISKTKNNLNLRITEAFGDKFGNGIMALSAFLGGFACAFGLGWLMALVMCAILPLQVVGAAVMANVVQQTQSETQGVGMCHAGKCWVSPKLGLQYKVGPKTSYK